MSLVQASTSVEQVKADQLGRFVDIALQDIVATINGMLDFQTNFNAKLISVTFPSANTSQSVAHGLGRVPSGYIVTGSSANLVVFNGTSASSTSTLSLQASAAGTVGLLVF